MTFSSLAAEAERALAVAGRAISGGAARRCRARPQPGSDEGVRRAAGLLVWLVLAPTVVLLALGLVTAELWEPHMRIVFAGLVVTLGSVLTAGTVLALSVLRSHARLSRLQAEFVSKVSHELRTPLTSIAMFVETLKSKRARTAEQQQQCLDALERETARLREQIDRLLDWGRIEAGRRVYSPRPTAVDTILREAIAMVAPATADRGQRVELELEDGLPEVMVERAAVVGSVVNLLSNASKYSPRGAAIEVGARRQGERVRLWVSDHGIGIPAHEHRNVFKKFYRVDGEPARSVEGVGLGLAIVRHVVRGHGGEIELQSAPGEGSTFAVLLPVAGRKRG